MCGENGRNKQQYSGGLWRMTRGNKINTRQVTGLFLIVTTCVILFWYLWSHPIALSGLMNVTPVDLVTINLLYVSSILTLSMNLSEIVRCADKRITAYESLLVTSYSSWANYLVPGQSGPGLRAIYLKAKHGVPISLVMTGTLLYLLWLVAISTCMVFYAAFASGQRSALFMTVAMLVAALVITIMLKVGSAQQIEERFAARIRIVVATGFFTLIQLVLIGVIYYVELTAIDSRISIAQTAGYAGIANLSLLVAITPGALGIREAFLAISQDIHNIPVETIAAASAVDRASYLVLLAELSIFIALSHAREQFRLGE